MIGKKIIICLILSSSFIFSQHRGDNLSFQGVDNFANQSVKAAAMGGAYTSQSGSIDALFYNPAGLRGIKSLEVSAAVNFGGNKWYENQVYRPNRYFVTLPFYLEGLYTPDPAQNGMFDHERLWTDEYLLDTTYVVNAPRTGLDPQSEEAADWKEQNNISSLTHFAVAVPFNLFDYNFTGAVSYGREVNINDFDRNETFLDPHIGFDAYGEMGRVNGQDTLVVDWYDYYRKRTGQIDNISAAINFELNEYLSFGIGGKYSWGESDDIQRLDKIGYFTLIRQNQFRYSYDTSYQYISGLSEYSSTSFNLGVHFQLKKITVGVKIDLPYTQTREYNYTESVLDSVNSYTKKISGSDKAKYPMIINTGISFKPVDNLILALDYRYAPYSKTEFELSKKDTTFANWVDQHTFSVGVDYQPFEFLSLQAGYRQIPQTFVPEGAATKDAGPNAESINAGLGIHTKLGSIYFAYEYRVLRYYDSYFSNSNYNTNQFSNFMIGYNISL